MQKDCIFPIKVCIRKFTQLHKAQTLPAHKEMKALERPNEGSKEKVTNTEKNMLFWELKAIVECYGLAFITVVVKCIACFLLPLKLLFCLGTENLGREYESPFHLILPIPETNPYLEDENNHSEYLILISHFVVSFT